MGGSKAQTVGYKYFKGVMAVIGNRIEQLLDINPDNRGYIMTPEQKKLLKSGRISLTIDQPNLFGGDKKEGGWVGALDIYVGEDNQPQNPYLAKQIGADVSAYPNRSYLVFHGLDTIITPENFEIEQRPSLTKGFQLVSMSGMMKEFMLWVKRTRIRNDGRLQWYERNSSGDIVCEIGAYRKESSTFINPESPQDIKVDGSYWDKLTGNTIDAESIDLKFMGWFSNNWHFNPDVTGAGIVQSISSEVEDLTPYGKITTLNIGTAKLPFVKAKIIIEYYGDSSVEMTGRFISSKIIHEENHSTPNAIGYSKKIEYEVIVDISKTPIKISVETDKVIRKLPDNGGFIRHSIEFHALDLVDSAIVVENTTLDINPIHKIREILTDDIAMGKPEADINDENFRFAADRIYDEGLGISWCIQEKSCKEALDELGYHIEGGVRQNRQTGLYEVILFRDDLLELDSALHFDETNIKSFQPDIINAEDQINAVNVSFYDRENIKNSSFPLSDVGSFHTIDHENADELKFPYFMHRRNAELVGNWKLKQLSTMAWKGTFTTGRYEARKLNKYDVILLSWKSKNIINLPVRVMNINLGGGRDNTVTLDFVEVVPYSNISYSSINVDPNPNPILSPQSNSSIVFEMPYLEAVQRMGQTSVDAELANNPEIGYLMAAAIKPQNNSLNALLYTDGGSESLDLLEEVGVVDYCATSTLDQNISRMDESFAVKLVKDLSRVKLGTLVQVDEELLVYESYDPETRIMTVKRGALDTIPKPHLKDAVFYFWDDSSGLDQTVYVDGETVHAKILTTTPSGVENLGTSAVRTLEIGGRANRPYPPANVKINDLYYPELIIASSNIDVSWVDRNRLQQTGGSILGFFDGGVTRESNVTYSLELSSENVVLYSASNINANLYSVPSSILIQNKLHKLKLWSVRDGFESYQVFEHEFFVEAASLALTATVSKDKVIGSTVAAASINVVVDELLSANMKFDGSNIKGKTLPNSTITIEVDE